jgi:hypothetical protein
MSVVLIIEIHFGKMVFLHNSFEKSDWGLDGSLTVSWDFFLFN